MNEVADNNEIKSKLYEIIIIDNDKFTISILESYFKSKGYNAKGIQSGIDGLEILRKSKPKLILLSIMLPDINGFEVCKTIKTDKKLKNIPVYYITTFPEAYMQEKMEDSRADGFFLKPFKFKDFEKLLEYL